MKMKLYGRSLKSLLENCIQDLQFEQSSEIEGFYTFCYQNNQYWVREGDTEIQILRNRLVCRSSSENIPVSVDEGQYGTATPHSQLVEVIHQLYYFFIHVQRYSGLILDQTHCRFTLQYFLGNGTVKKRAEDKRIDSKLHIEELMDQLMFYQGGYVLNKEQGNISIANRKRFVIQGYGYDFDQKQAVRKAVLEYLERCAAAYELEGTVEGTYEQLGKAAIDPVNFGVYPPEISTKFRLPAYDPKLRMKWVKASSLLTQHDYLVPEQLVQYLREDLLNQYVYDSSNGCAIGNSLAEASLFALLEAIERDRFMKCWFLGEPIKHIQFNQLDELHLQGKQLFFEELGYSLDFYYLDNPMKLPIIWCLITSQKEDQLIYSVTGLGCHLHVRHAIAAAFFEAYKSFKDLHEQDQEKLKEKIKRVEQSQQINEVIEHIYFFLSYKSKPVVEKRTNGTESISYTELLANSYEHQDLEQELQELILRAKDVYTDLLMVNQENGFLNAFGLSCTKALLLGALPLDFTSHFIREHPQDQTNRKLELSNIHPLA